MEAFAGSDGPAEWRNIQDVVRTSFKALHEVVKHQAEAIRRLEGQLESKASKHEMEMQLSQKASSVELAHALQDVHAGLQTALGQKANLGDMARGFEEQGRLITSKLSAQDVGAMLDAKVCRADIQHVLDGRMLSPADVEGIYRENHRLGSEVKQLEACVCQMQEQLRAKADSEAVAMLNASLSNKVNVGHYEPALEGKASKQGLDAVAARQTRVAEAHEQLARTVDRLLAAQAEKVDRAVLENELQRKADCCAMEEYVLDRNRDCAGAAHKELRAEAEHWGLALGATQTQLSAAQGELDEAVRRVLAVEQEAARASHRLEQVADRAELLELLADKASLWDLQELQGTACTQEEHRAALQHKASLEQLERLQEQLTALQQQAEMLGESSQQHQQALAHRPTAQQMEELHQTLSSEIHLKANQLQLSDFVHEQSYLNQSVINELVVGRWIWNSHHCKAGGAVPWNVQVVNTRAGSYTWKKDSTKIVAVQAGLYEVCWGFFTRSRPSVQLLLNGEPCLVSSGNLHTHGTRASGVKHPAGNVTGHTVIDFLALPAKAKVSIHFNGESPTEGFLSLRKL